ncbi:MAG: NADH-quinone oxidoreductase subunit N [Firmicutes bacterium]|nr:NADH-quinone oxidoreductase subunit N [Bacillota bacterium]
MSGWLIPEGVLLAGLAAVLLVAGGGWGRLASWLAGLALLASAAAALLLPGGEHPVLAGAFLPDRLSGVIDGLAVLAGLAALLLGPGAGTVPEAPALVLTAVLGAEVLGAAGSLLTVFVGLELLSFPLYVLVALGRSRTNLEAGVKYLLMGTVASGLFLFGMALIYRQIGSFTFLRLDGESAQPWVEVGLGLVFGGLLFKLAIVPFHMWAPDVYEGAPTPVTAFMALATKAGALAALIRVLSFGFYPGAALWSPLLAYLAALSILTGNLLALVQRDLKRLVGWSAVAAGGYLLVGLAAHSVLGDEAGLYFLAAYGLGAIGFLTVAGVAAGEPDRGPTRQALRGLAYRRPGMALAFGLAALSLAGIPFTGGFLGKVYLLQAAVAAGQPGLAVAVALGAAVGLLAYLRPLEQVFRRDAAAVVPHPAPGPALVLAVTAVLTLALGVWPGPVVHWLGQAARFYWLH